MQRRQHHAAVALASDQGTLIPYGPGHVSRLVAESPRYTIVKAKGPRGPELGPLYHRLRKRFADASAMNGMDFGWPGPTAGSM